MGAWLALQCQLVHIVSLKATFTGAKHAIRASLRAWGALTIFQLEASLAKFANLSIAEAGLAPIRASPAFATLVEHIVAGTGGAQVAVRGTFDAPWLMAFLAKASFEAHTYGALGVFDLSQAYS